MLRVGKKKLRKITSSNTREGGRIYDALRKKFEPAWFAVIIPILIGLMYVAGSAYYSAYLSKFGIDSSQFQLSVQDTMVYGHIYGLLIAIKIALWTTGAALVAMVIGALISEVKDSSFSSGIAKKFAVNRNEERRTKRGIGNYIFEKSLRFSLISIVFVVGVYGYFNLIQHLTENAKHDAEAVIGAIINNDAKKIADLNLKKIVIQKFERTGAEKSFVGYRIACTEKFCALFSQSGLAIVPLEGIEYIALDRKPK